MTNTSSSKGLNLALWIAQTLLAVLFLMTGANKAFQPVQELSQMMPWVAEVPEILVKFIGLSEVLGGLGLLLPSLLRIRPILTPIAAAGLAVVMLFASLFHLSRGEISVIGFNLVLMGIALFIAWGRSKKIPVLPKA